MSDLEALKAAFLAKGGTVTVAPASAAYGVNPEIDKARRESGRQAMRDKDCYAQIERDSENYMQQVRESRGYYKS